MHRNLNAQTNMSLSAT